MRGNPPWTESPRWRARSRSTRLGRRPLAGSGPLQQAIDEGLEVERLVFVAPPFGPVDFWERHGERHRASTELVEAARDFYEATVGLERATLDWRQAFLALKAEILSSCRRTTSGLTWRGRPSSVARHRRTQLATFHGLSHRRTERDPAVVKLVADFVSSS